jgi:hypothetical protein
MRSSNVLSYVFFSASLILLSSCSGVSIDTGENFEVVELPDGSIVFMNHNSAIKFDEAFTPRSIEVDGEVFLSVMEGETPFVVKSKLGEISVLGTEFNVKSYADELEVEVEEGVVELKTIAQSEKIKRGEAALYNKAKSEFKKVKAEFKFKIWMKDLKAEFKALGKELKTNSKEIGKESKKAGRKLKKELKKLR